MIMFNIYLLNISFLPRTLLGAELQGVMAMGWKINTLKLHV